MPRWYRPAGSRPASAAYDGAVARIGIVGLGLMGGSLGLAARGSRVALSYTRSVEEAERTAAKCRDLGVDAIAVMADAGDDAACRGLAAAALARWGRIDVLVNNAGKTKFVPAADLDGLSADDFFDMYRVNVVGAFQMIRACAPAMRAQGFGAVVNVSSIAGVNGIGSSVAYAASKGALNTMTLTLARALAPAIRVNAVCPGFIDTRWFSDALGEETAQNLAASQAAGTPLKRAGTAEDIAKAVLFLADEGSEHMTGVTLLSDAGLHLGMMPQIERTQP